MRNSAGKRKFLAEKRDFWAKKRYFRTKKKIFLGGKKYMPIENAVDRMADRAEHTDFNV